MTYTFSVSQLRSVLTDTISHAHHHVPYTGPSWGNERKTTPGILLVGDRGVYIMTNADPMPDDRTIAYAAEADPDRLPFDEWWDAKRDGFGGDDGAEFLALPQFIQWVHAHEKAGLTAAHVDLDATHVAYHLPGPAAAGAAALDYSQ